MYGVFTNEGCAASDYYTEEDADAARTELLATEYEGDELTVAETCPDHPEAKADECEDCADAEHDDWE